ncbi:protein CYSTEINE-RICH TRANSMEMBRANE MODULE 6 [Vitis vinifera]|uniref:Cysteine-rich transmembrane domain-containing protein n=1 Tax=Vitis vinifera TaxID=29760 RepID=D7TUA6_VITVI|eukprot:XP_002271223.1 PREDICTED: cysteine-rich and transmembrane domain-containing protein A [Vitis vinifera]
MSYPHQKQPSVAGYPPQPASTAYPAGPYVAPPPVGYPMKHGHDYPQNPAAGETKAKGDGFLKGCCAALCCCCLLDACF